MWGQVGNQNVGFLTLRLICLPISDDLEDSQLLGKKTGEENSALKTELEKAQETITEKSGMVIDLQGKHLFWRHSSFSRVSASNAWGLEFDP